tara:strand:- start:73 stop:327 length:255 start_codon:yes stop_codon:yes gene_type:complete
MAEEIKKILDRWAKKGWAARWCEGCRIYTLLCPFCSHNACGGETNGCNGCGATHMHSQKMQDEIAAAKKAAANKDHAQEYLLKP